MDNLLKEYEFAKIMDKVDQAVHKNKCTHTDFYTENEIAEIKKVLVKENISNYEIVGVVEEPAREIIVFYPQKFTKEIVDKFIHNTLKILRISLPKELSYSHSEYLGGIMKTGIKREKLGDIIVVDNAADVIILDEVSKYLMDNLGSLTRFNKAHIGIYDINYVFQKKVEFEDVLVNVASNRLDNIVGELAHVSRGKAEEIINEGRVFINNVNEFKDSKKIIINDIITIRGKGKFIFEEEIGKTKSDRLKLRFKKYK